MSLSPFSFQKLKWLKNVNSNQMDLHDQGNLGSSFLFLEFINGHIIRLDTSSEINLYIESHINKEDLLDIPFPYFHFSIKRRRFNIKSCSCSSSDCKRMTNKDSKTEDNFGTYCNPRSFWTTKTRLDSSTMISIPPDSLRWHKYREKIVSNNSKPHCWASKFSCQNKI